MNTTAKSWFTVLCLLTTSLVTVATSKAPPPKTGSDDVITAESKQYYVASNCPAALPQDQITVTNETISYPTNLQFADFGLPLTRLNFEMYPQVKGWVRGYQMLCYLSVMEADSDTGLLHVYNCYENNRPICQVSFEQVLQRQ
ncbi:MAG TPA: hypothetical protein VIG33_14975 [Pseudobdellovibrionaceae bacterium]|jgi:hypothetical protein